MGQAAGRQSRVAASPSSSTWSLSLMWKTGGKSGGRTEIAMGVREPRLTDWLREGTACMRAGAASGGSRVEGCLFSVRCGKENPKSCLQEFSLGSVSSSLGVVLSFPFIDYEICLRAMS